MNGWRYAQRVGTTTSLNCTASGFVVLCALSILFLCGLGVFAEQNVIAPPPQQPSQQFAASIAGHVYRADTGAPLPGAIVTLFKVPVPATPGQPNIPELQAARTNADGSYSFSVDSGRYHIEAKRSGFTKSVPPPVLVTAGQAVLAVDFRLQAAEQTQNRGRRSRLLPKIPQRALYQAVFTTKTAWRLTALTSQAPATPLGFISRMIVGASRFRDFHRATAISRLRLTPIWQWQATSELTIQTLKRAKWQSPFQ